MKLKDKTAVVTGGGSGIGEAIGRTFANEGARVVITGRSAAKLQASIEGAGAAAARLIPFAADVSDPASVKELFAFAHKELGHIDILVNNAGGNVPKRKLTELSNEDFRFMTDVNLNGIFYCVHEVLPGMRERKSGLIINVSSIAGVRASVLAGAGYSASKHGAAGLSLAIGIEEGMNGIRSSMICPGEVNTPILEKRPVVPGPEARAKMLQPEDLAAAALMIATLDPRANIPELVITPTIYPYS